MVLTNTPPSTPLNISEMLGDELELDDYDDLEEITADDLGQLQLSDDCISVDDNEDEEDEGNNVDDSVSTLKGHTGSVFCCQLDPRDGRLAITGGEDDKVFFWDTQSGEVIFQDSGFKDSVTCVEFSQDGKYVAAGDMGGIIKVWRVPISTPSTPPEEVWTDTVEEILWLRWHQKAHILLCGVTFGEVFMWKIPGGTCKILAGHGLPANMGQFMPDGKRAVVGYSDGVVRVYDLNSCSANCSVQSPEMGAIISLAAHPDNNLVAAGTMNSKVALFSSQTGKIVSLFSCGRERESEDTDNDSMESVESLVFSKEPSLPLLAVGTLSAVVIWDFSKQVLRHRCEVVEGITQLLWDVGGPLVYVATQKGHVKVLDSRAATVESTLRGHSSEVLDMALSRDGTKLITASDDTTVKIFSLGTVPLS